MAAGLTTRRQAIEVKDSSVFSFADYLQLACMTRRSVHLSAIKDGQALGGVIVLTGEVWHAWDETGVGTEAFKHLALMECEVSVMPHSGTEPRRTVEGSWERLMMDAAVEKDELSRSLPSPPPSYVAPVASGVTATGSTSEVQETHAAGMDSGLVNKQSVPPTEQAVATFQPTTPSARPVPVRPAPSSPPTAHVTQTTLMSSLGSPSIVARARTIAFRIRWFVVSAAALLGFGIGWNFLLSPWPDVAALPSPSNQTTPVARAQRVAASPPTVVPEPTTREEAPPFRAQERPEQTRTRPTPTAPLRPLPELQLAMIPAIVQDPNVVALPKRPRRRSRRSRRSNSPARRKTTARLAQKNSPKLASVDGEPDVAIVQAPVPVLASDTEGDTAADGAAIKPKILPAATATDTEVIKRPKPNNSVESAVPSTPPAKKSKTLTPVPVKPDTAGLRAKTHIVEFRMVGPPSSDRLFGAITKGRRRFTQCYRKAAVAAGRNAYGKVFVQVTVDRHGYISAPQATGGILPGLNRCVANVAGKLRTRRRAGVGRLQLKWTLNYVP